MLRLRKLKSSLKTKEQQAARYGTAKAVSETTLAYETPAVSTHFGERKMMLSSTFSSNMACYKSKIKDFLSKKRDHVRRQEQTNKARHIDVTLGFPSFY